jgi:chemotaxis protein CheX
MPATQSISDQLIQDSLIRAVQNVCRTMLQQDATFTGRTSEPQIGMFSTSKHVFGSVGFVGEVNGIVYLCIPDDFATDAAARILGMSPAEVEYSGDEVVKDVVGEVTNMTVGGFKNALCDVGFPCKLTLPTIVRGNNLSVASIKSATRHIFSFDSGGHRLVADIQIKAD